MQIKFKNPPLQSRKFKSDEETKVLVVNFIEYCFGKQKKSGEGSNNNNN